MTFEKFVSEFTEALQKQMPDRELTWESIRDGQRAIIHVNGDDVGIVIQSWFMARKQEVRWNEFPINIIRLTPSFSDRLTDHLIENMDSSQCDFDITITVVGSAERTVYWLWKRRGNVLKNALSEAQELI